MQIDKGEPSAIALALETPNCTVILDDYKARKIADLLSISYTGTIGVIIKAKLKNIIPSIIPLLEKIKKTDFRISAEIELLALKEANERYCKASLYYLVRFFYRLLHHMFRLPQITRRRNEIYISVGGAKNDFGWWGQQPIKQKNITMGHIKGPKGIDFIIKSRPLTKAEELAISKHIKNYKLKNNNLSAKPKQSVTKRKAQVVLS